MRIFLFSTIMILFFAGCSQKISDKVQNYSLYEIPKTDTTKSTVENLNDNGTIFKVTTSANGKVEKKGAMLLVITTMQKTVEETKRKGYRYFQVISPTTISNASGFPINTVADLTTFLVPQSDNVPEGYNGMINAIETHSAIDLPLTIFGTSKFEVVVRIVEEPKYYDIVWDTNKY